MEHKVGKRGSEALRWALSVAAVAATSMPVQGMFWEATKGEQDRVVKYRLEGSDSLVIQQGFIQVPAHFPLNGSVPGSAVTAGPHGWLVFNDGELDALAGTLWSWNASTEKWQERRTTGEQPNLSLPHMDFSDGSRLQRLTMGDELAVHELNLTTGTWSLRLKSETAGWSPEAGPFNLQDFVVWASEGQILYIFDKRTDQLASFPSDAWAGHLAAAEGAEIVRTGGGNVLEFGSTSGALNRFDFNEKVRYASFSSPFEWALADQTLEVNNNLFSNWSFWLLLGTWGMFVVWWWRNRGVGANNHEADNGTLLAGESALPQEVLDSIAHWSDPLKLVVLSDQSVFTASELDELFDIHDIASPETLRAKRSRLIQGVNTEFNLLFGYDLIRRKRDDNDRRKVLYTRSGLPPQLAKSLHRNRVHQFHANDGADRTDRVTEDR